jgi:L-methionine (R)-S-oxide reductase
MSDPPLPDDRSALLLQIRQLAATAPSLRVLQTGFVESVARQLRHYNWVGFYMLDPADAETLVLGPFAGEPTPHVRIPVSQGICGAAVAGGETVVVDDVSADPRYLSCSIRTKSEIVVPIFARTEIIGEIDVDSHDFAAFNAADRIFLEHAARIVGNYIEAHSGEAIAS